MHHCKKVSGFSLIEIMVVMVLIGLMFSVATVTINSGGANKKMRETAEDFVTAADHFREVSIASGLPVGVLFEPPQWQNEDLDAPWRITWYKLIPVVVEPNAQLDSGLTEQNESQVILETQVRPQVIDTWVEIEGLPDWKRYTEILLELKIQGEVFEFEREPPEIVTPQLVIYPTGEVTPFELVITHRDDSELLETVTLDEWGDVIWKEESEKLKEIEELKSF